jgi:hypothetical protein
MDMSNHKQDPGIPTGLLWESNIAHPNSEDRAYGLWLNGPCSESERAQAINSMNR